MRAANIAVLAIAAFAMILGSAQAQTPPTPDAAAPSAPDAAAPAPIAGPASFANVEANYTIGLGDVLSVEVVGRSEYSPRVRVGPDGDIVLPLIGAVKAVGLRPPQLAEQVRASLVKGSYYANPVIRVEVVLVASRYVTVLGQVGSPGLISLDRNYRLSEILAKVGARIGAGGGDYVVLTHEDGTQQKLRMTEIATGVANQDPVVLSGDKIFVPAAENEVIYVNGAVRAPGMFPIMAGMTVRTALARAGGVDENGSEGKFDLYRKGEKVRDATLDTPLQVGDIVKFGERMF